MKLFQIYSFAIEAKTALFTFQSFYGNDILTSQAKYFLGDKAARQYRTQRQLQGERNR